MALDDFVPRSSLQHQHNCGQPTRLLNQLYPPNDHRRRLLAVKANEQLLRQQYRHRVRQKPIQPHHPSHPVHQCLHSGAGSRRFVSTSESTDSSLQLKVRCRMSMSLVFDSVWRWREEFQAQGRDNLECMPILPSHPSQQLTKPSPSRAQKSHEPRLRRRILRHLPRRQQSRSLSPPRRRHPHTF